MAKPSKTLIKLEKKYDKATAAFDRAEKRRRAAEKALEPVWKKEIG